MGLRMGMNNRVTPDRYYRIKKSLKKPEDDKKAMKEFGIGAATAQRIRRTKDFAEYYSINTTGKKERKRVEAVLADLRDQNIAPEPKMWTYIPKDAVSRVKIDNGYDDGVSGVTVFAFIVVILAIITFAIWIITLIIFLDGNK